MKRHLVARPPAPVVLSVEEEAILIDEQNETFNDLVVLNADAERMVEVSEIATDTQSVLSQVPEAGDVETGLVNAVGEMAASGTDVDPESVSTTITDAVSTEGFISNALEQLRKMWEAIKTYLAKMWQHIRDFFTKGRTKDNAIKVKAEKNIAEVENLNAGKKSGGAHTITPAQRQKIDQHAKTNARNGAIDAIKEVLSKPKAINAAPANANGMFKPQHFKLDLHLVAMPNGKVPKDKMTEELKRLHAFAFKTFESFSDSFLDASDLLEDLFKHLNKDNYKEVLQTFVQKYSQNSVHVLNKMGFPPNTDSSKNESWMKEEFIGDFQVRGTSYQALGKDAEEDLETQIVRLRSVKFQVVVSDLRAPPDMMLPLLEGEVVKGLSHSVIDWIDNYSTSPKVMRALEEHIRASNEIKAAMDRLINEAGRQTKDADAATKEYHKYIYVLNHLVQAAQARSAALFVDLFRAVQRINNAATEYCIEVNGERGRMASSDLDDTVVI
jgi:hypothetical protein